MRSFITFVNNITSTKYVSKSRENNKKTNKIKIAEFKKHRRHGNNNNN